MYRVEVYLRVRRAVMVEGMSVREVSRVFGLHRDTVRKMLAYSVPPGYRRQRQPRRPKLEPYTGVIDRILGGSVCFWCLTRLGLDVPDTITKRNLPDGRLHLLLGEGLQQPEYLNGLRLLLGSYPRSKRNLALLTGHSQVVAKKVPFGYSVRHI